MKYVIDHDMHIHTRLSRCSRDPEQTPERIFQYAKLNGLKTVCITNHLWDSAVKACCETISEHTYEVLSSELPLPQSENVKMLFGCETDIDINGTIGVSDSLYEKLDFIILSTTHLHLKGFTVRENITLDERAKIYTDKLFDVLKWRTDLKKSGIAHPVTGHASPGIPFNELYAKIDKGALKEAFTELAHRGAGVEINGKDFNFDGKSAERGAAVLEFYGILKDCGCRFYLGGDAHHPKALDEAPALFKNAVELLQLTEKDKFILPE